DPFLGGRHLALLWFCLSALGGRFRSLFLRGLGLGNRVARSLRLLLSRRLLSRRLLARGLLVRRRFGLGGRLLLSRDLLLLLDLGRGLFLGRDGLGRRRLGFGLAGGPALLLDLPELDRQPRDQRREPANERG